MNTMKSISTALLSLLMTLLFSNCGSRNSEETSSPTFPEQPSREAHEGFQWEIVSGSGIKFWAQRNERLSIDADSLLPGAWMLRDSLTSGAPLIKQFALTNNRIEDVLDLLKEMPGWNSAETCEFKEYACKRAGVKRYVLVPEGAYAKEFEEKSKLEPIPSTCNGWGIGNSGARYFEIHSNHPDRALFIEIGQEAPLFDEESIVWTDEPASGKFIGSISQLTGTLIIGHEVRSFAPHGDKNEYWLIDKTGKLAEAYDRLTGGIKNGKPIEATLKVKYMGKYDEGFAANYAGVYQVLETTKLNKTE